ncbi:hypothetical protein KSP39_PZI013227 [Platanthera zijinensis]|uniref:DUF7796 domain-containing protein n=1 Tax=Platanthera zijinensis TaxID=2320716 RepID=A0AAP0G446_9ASPA
MTSDRFSAGGGRRFPILSPLPILLLSLSPFLAIITILSFHRSGVNPLISLPGHFKSLPSLSFLGLRLQSDLPIPPETKRRRRMGRSSIAICLVGGARRFEITGPSIVKNLLLEYPNADLFLHSPLDKDAFKFLLLKSAPRIAGVRIFDPSLIPATESQIRVLSPRGSPNGIQGLLQYFNLVEGCLSLISAYESRHNFTYDWIVRTRVDGYWAGPLDPFAFRRAVYVVPPGSRFGGLNDRFGVGDRASSAAALSRLSLIPRLDAAGYKNLNSESAFKAQLTISKVRAQEMPQPFCVVSDRRYGFPPGRRGVPVASMETSAPLNGAKCRPCAPTFGSECLKLDGGWSSPEWTEGGIEICNATGAWEEGWESVFDGMAGDVAAIGRRQVMAAEQIGCEEDFERLRRRTEIWDAPPATEVCRLGLSESGSTSKLGL